MWYSWLADLILCIHLGFVLFVVFGGLLILKWRWIVWLHLPAAIWGAVVEFTGWICPLTPLENWLREQGSETLPIIPTSSRNICCLSSTLET